VSALLAQAPHSRASTGSLRPDAVLLDLVLPRLDGVEVARRLRNDPATADIRIIATTASWLGEKWDFLASAGFGGALRKPFTGAELFAKHGACDVQRGS
jgi:CheY-like chemotaxis protein